MKKEDVQELLAIIDQTQKVEFGPEKMFQPTGRMYSTLKILYQNYKKNHELEIIQARTFNLRVDDKQRQHFTQTPVSASFLFEYHSLTEQDILLLIEVKELIKDDPKKELYQQILSGIGKLQSVSSCLKCYRKLLNHQFLRSDLKEYQAIEDQMIKKVLSLEHFGRRQVRVIGQNILGLPRIGQPILVFISELCDKIDDIEDILFLQKIFEANFPQNPTVTDYEALFKISTPQTLSKIKELIEKDSPERPNLLIMAEKEAKYKLRTMGPCQTSKTKQILEFIVEMVKLGFEIWQDIILWESSAEQSSKSLLKSKVQSILIVILNDFRYFETVIKIAEQLQKNEKHSVIGLIFVGELLRLESSEYLSHRTIRKLLAIKILNYNSSEGYSQQIFSTNFKFIEVINQMFNYKTYIVNFYQHIINDKSYSSFDSFDKFLEELSTRYPVKYKDFFCKMMLVDTERSQYLSSNMFKLLVDRLPASVASSFVKDLAGYPPGKYLLSVLGKMLTKIKTGEVTKYNAFKANVVRTLNIMLTRTAKSDFNLPFQVGFPSFLKEHLYTESNDVFKNVSLETKEELKRNFDKHSKLKAY